MSDVLDKLPLPSVSIEEEMKRSYLDYAMSVIVARAIPDVRDGLKPVHRRILYGMREINCDWNKPFKKSARIVGEVMGKYHPHGDSAIYDALVRMAQGFSMSLTLVDGQGNFGSMDGDNAAAMRYTEARLSKAAHALMTDLDKDTVSFQDNYDGAEQEPSVLPAEYPNILVNGAGGIAVGMATNIPPHNLGEVIDATCMLIDNPDSTIDEMMQVIPGPDFPTHGIILGRSGSRASMHTGRGSIILRATASIEDAPGGRSIIVFTDVPYQVNKARLYAQISQLVAEKRLEGISAVNDESDKDGVRLVVEVKRDAIAEVVLNQLYAFTQLQVSFASNILALNNGRPEQLNLRTTLQAFIQFREEVISRRTAFLLGKARDRAHTLIGLAIAVANIDEVIAVIRGSRDPNEAREELMKRSWDAADVGALLALVEDHRNVAEGGKIRFTDAQARAILDLRLHRLTGLEREKIDEELQQLAAEISDHLETLGSREKMMRLLRAELVSIKEQFAVPRRTVIEEAEFEQDIEDLIPQEDMVVTVTLGGYIKRTSLSAYRAQRRGGKGRAGLTMREEDVTTDVFIANTHTPVLFFSSTGQVYKLKVYKLPEGSPQSRGKAMVNIFPLAEHETIQTLMPLPQDEAEWEGLNIMFSTRKGNVRRNDLSDFHDVRRNGKIAIRLDEDDQLIAVRTCAETDHVLLAAKSGKCVRFPVSAVRVFKSRTSDGVRGMKLADKDVVVSMSILKGAEIDMETRETYLRYANSLRRAEHEADAPIEEAPLPKEIISELALKEEFILTITENGYGKRSSAYEYRVTNRGGSGITNIITSARNGAVVTSFAVADNDQIMLISDKGTLIRCPVKDIRIAGRSTQGVTLFRTAEGEHVVSAAHIGDVVEEGEATEQAGLQDIAEIVEEGVTVVEAEIEADDAAEDADEE